MDVINFSAQVVKIQTLADGGIRLTLDLCEDAIKQASELMQVKQRGAMLEIAAVPVLLGLTNGENKAEQRTARNPLDVAGC